MVLDASVLLIAILKGCVTVFAILLMILCVFCLVYAISTQSQR